MSCPTIRRAGKGDRTLVSCLGSKRSTTELHPRFQLQLLLVYTDIVNHLPANYIIFFRIVLCKIHRNFRSQF